MSSPPNVSLLEYKRRKTKFQTTERLQNIEDQMYDMTVDLKKTRERVDFLSHKLDLLLGYICKKTQFEMDDI